MALRDWLFDQTQRIRRRARLPILTGIEPFRIAPEERGRLEAEASTDLERLFFRHRGRTIHKWVHYLSLYDRHFARYRQTPLKMLELGVSQGGSLELWREFFGPQATIFGIDVDPACADRVTPPNQVRIGSQADPAFLRTVLDEMGAPDIILDDGSHIAEHQRASFEILFPALRPGGLYVIEDLHTAYWPGCHSGGYRRAGTAIELVKQIIDDMHGWYHDKPLLTPAKDEILGVHAYDSIVFLEKGVKSRPGNILVR